MFKFPALSALSSGSNLVKISVTEQVKQLRNKFSVVSIITSCGTFVIFSENYDRLSEKLLTSFLEDDVNSIHCRAWDHETFLFLHRYIEFGIKVNLTVLCERLGINRSDGLKLLERWGYDGSIVSN